MKGRKPLPTAVKLAKGVRKARINFAEPKIPPAEDLSPPAGFYSRENSYARDHWEAVVPHLAKAGLVTAVDRPALEAMCLCYEVWRLNPANRNVMGEWRRLATEFGMTPCSRSKIKVDVKEADELELFLGGAS